MSELLHHNGLFISTSLGIQHSCGVNWSLPLKVKTGFYLIQGMNSLLLSAFGCQTGSVIVQLGSDC